MKSLSAIVAFSPLQVPRFHRDQFQQQVLEQLHLEFFFKECRVLITPELGYLTTGPSTEQEENQLLTILEKHADRLERLKEYLLYSLSLYSALLDTNSYYIALNRHLVIARFIPLAGTTTEFEVKVYTTSREDLGANYKDKIYIGRDSLSLSTLRKEHFGLRYIRDSLQEQFQKLRGRIRDHVPETQLPELEQEYIGELQELVTDSVEACNRILESLPVEMVGRAAPEETLIEANTLFREVKHVLFEVEETSRELERRMFEHELSRAVRYVTKFRKDITNDINYITIKVNGRISDHVNGIHW